VPASEIEKLILSAVRKHLTEKAHNKMGAENSPSLNDKNSSPRISHALT
jgi:hypothetical protein